MELDPIPVEIKNQKQTEEIISFPPRSLSLFLRGFAETFYRVDKVWWSTVGGSSSWQGLAKVPDSLWLGVPHVPSHACAECSRVTIPTGVWRARAGPIVAWETSLGTGEPSLALGFDIIKLLAHSKNSFLRSPPTVSLSHSVHPPRHSYPNFFSPPTHIPTPPSTHKHESLLTPIRYIITLIVETNHR